MQPSEFWRLPIADFWVEFDGHAEASQRASGKPEKVTFTPEELARVRNWERNK